MTDINREIAELLGAEYKKVNEGTYSVHWKGTVGYGCSYGQAMYHLNIPDWETSITDALEFCGQTALLYGYHLIIEFQYERNRIFAKMVPFHDLADFSADRPVHQADGSGLAAVLAQLALMALLHEKEAENTV